MEEKNVLINTFFKQFQTLTCEDKNRTLDCLIEKLDSAQLYHLSTQLEKLIKRDFIVQLPEEISQHLLKFVDIESLLNCCQVSRNWYRIISSCHQVWKNACVCLGIKINDPVLCESTHKKLYLQNKKMLHQMRKGTLFSSAELYGHMDRVMAVYYNAGFLATGSDDHTVRIWDCETGECVHVLRTHSVADIKFYSRRVFTASFDTTAACWDIDTGQTIAHYIGHVGAVFSIDFNEEMNIVVTGSADSTVKLWSLESGQLYQTLTQHRSAWITHVYLFPNVTDNTEINQTSSTEGLPRCDNTKSTSTKVLSKKSESLCIQSHNSNNGYYIVSQDNMSLHSWKVEVNGNEHTVSSSEEWQNNTGMALLPGLWQCHDRSSSKCKENSLSVFCIAFLIESTIQIYECEFTKNVLLLSNMKLKRMCRLPNGVYPQTYLGSGNQFDVFLVDNDCGGFDRGPGLYMIHTGDPSIHSNIPIPPDYRPSKRGSSFTLCNTQWMDNVLSLNHDVEERGPIFAVTMKDNRVYLIKCNNKN